MSRGSGRNTTTSPLNWMSLTGGSRGMSTAMWQWGRMDTSRPKVGIVSCSPLTTSSETTMQESSRLPLLSSFSMTSRYGRPSRHTGMNPTSSSTSSRQEERIWVWWTVRAGSTRMSTGSLPLPERASSYSSNGQTGDWSIFLMLLRPCSSGMGNCPKSQTSERWWIWAITLRKQTRIWKGGGSSVCRIQKRRETRIQEP